MSDKPELEILNREKDLAYQDRNIWRERALRYETVISQFIRLSLSLELENKDKDIHSTLWETADWAARVLHQEQQRDTPQIGGKLFCD